MRESPEILHEEPMKPSASPARLRMAMKAMAKMSVGEMHVEGREHLKEIPRGSKVIVATSHISDVELPLIVSALGKDFDFAVTHQSAHMDIQRELPSYLGIKLAGKENFVPLTWKFDENGKKSARFDEKDFAPAKEALKRGKALVMAAHNPSDGALSKPGVGASFIAETTDNVVILPVAVDIQYKKATGKTTFWSQMLAVFERPKAVIRIGRPIRQEKRSTTRESGSFSEKNRNERRELIERVRENSRNIMKELAAMLPPEKSGVFGSESEKH